MIGQAELPEIAEVKCSSLLAGKTGSWVAKESLRIPGLSFGLRRFGKVCMIPLARRMPLWCRITELVNLLLMTKWTAVDVADRPSSGRVSPAVVGEG